MAKQHESSLGRQIDMEAVASADARLLASIVETSDDAIISKTTSGIVTSWNPAAERMFGYSAQEMIGRPMTTIFPPDRLGEEQMILSKIFGGERVDHLETVRLRKDGTPINISVTISPLYNDAGIIVGASKIARDITERKRAEALLFQHAEELEQHVRVRTAEIEEARARLESALEEASSANRAKSAFLANISHEIRTPMNAIIGLTHLLARDATDGLQRDRLDKVDAAAQHLLQVINDVLDLSKIEAGKLVLDRREFVLDEVLERAVGMVRSRASEKGLELIVNRDHLPWRLLGDPMRLAQALINLLSNAVKFTSTGWVSLRGENVADDGDCILVRFEVRDTGPGLSAERQQRLFKPFEQGDNSTTRREGGTGLGLVLTRHFAELMGGQAGVVSQEGQGSTFWFTAKLEYENSPEHLVPPVIDFQGMRALVVDDLPEAREALEMQLSLLQLAVDVRSNAEEGLRQLDQVVRDGQMYDVLVVDWQMSDMDGIELLRRARLKLGAAMPPSILATAFDEQDMWRVARQRGVDAVLLKPVTVSSMNDALAGVLRRSGTPDVKKSLGRAETNVRQLHAGRRVLLVEDNPINLEIALELLRSVGLVVDPAVDGAQGVSLAASNRYDLVLMDMQMPVMDGLEATRQIRRQIGSNMPIIALTANAFGEDQAACLAAGMNDHLGKPADPEQLYAMLLRWLPKSSIALDVEFPVSEHVGVMQPFVNRQRPLAERLASVPGFNLAEGLSNVGGKTDVLVRILRTFLGTYRTGATGLLTAAERGDRASVMSICHSLKAACASVGATDAQSSATTLESSASDIDSAELLERARQLHNELTGIVGRLALELSA